MNLVVQYQFSVHMFASRGLQLFSQCVFFLKINHSLGQNPGPEIDSVDVTFCQFLHWLRCAVCLVLQTNETKQRQRANQCFFSMMPCSPGMSRDDCIFWIWFLNPWFCLYFHMFSYVLMTFVTLVCSIAPARAPLQAERSPSHKARCLNVRWKAPWLFPCSMDNKKGYP